MKCELALNRSDLVAGLTGSTSTHGKILYTRTGFHRIEVEPGKEEGTGNSTREVSRMRALEKITV